MVSSEPWDASFTIGWERSARSEREEHTFRLIRVKWRRRIGGVAEFAGVSVVRTGEPPLAARRFVMLTGGPGSVEAGLGAASFGRHVMRDRGTIIAVGIVLLAFAIAG